MINKCKIIKTGEICEYFILGQHQNPVWYNNEKGFFNDSNGDILVYSKRDNEILKYNSYSFSANVIKLNNGK